jgi:hypothetical protein
MSRKRNGPWDDTRGRSSGSRGGARGQTTGTKGQNPGTERSEFYRFARRCGLERDEIPRYQVARAIVWADRATQSCGCESCRRWRARRFA